MPSAPTPASALAALALTGAIVGAAAVTSAPPSAPAPAPSTERVSARSEQAPADSVPIDCGGYDADGDVANEVATRIGRAPLDAAGIPEIPPVCGGYTADGTFIGDD